MDKNVTLTISGLHIGQDGEDNIESKVSAVFFEKNNSKYLLYEEELPDFSEKIKNRIKFRDKKVEIIRQGLIDTHMVFDEGKEYVTNYSLPIGNFPISIDTESVEITEAETEIVIDVSYNLKLDKEQDNKSSIRIKIENRNT